MDGVGHEEEKTDLKLLIIKRKHALYASSVKFASYFRRIDNNINLIKS